MAVARKHPVLARAAVVGSMETLLTRCRQQPMPGLAPRGWHELCDHLESALTLSLRPSRLHPVAIVLQLFGVQVVAEAAESDHSTHPRGLRDRMALTMTLRRLLTEKLLAATIQAWRDEVLSEFFEKHSLLRIGQDRSTLVAILRGFEALPILPADPATLPNYPTEPLFLMYAKNNVLALVAEADDAVVPGYLSVLTPDHALHEQYLIDRLCRESERLVVSWTPNEHFARTALLQHLPLGWDEGYDPVTGHRYYIDHTTCTTTWVDPRIAAENAAPPPKHCNCVIKPASPTAETIPTPRCSVLVPLESSSRTSAFIECYGDAGHDSGMLSLLVTGEDAKAYRHARFFFKHGGLSTVRELLRVCHGCKTTSDVCDAATSTTAATLAAAVTTCSASVLPPSPAIVGDMGPEATALSAEETTAIAEATARAHAMAEAALKVAMDTRNANGNCSGNHNDRVDADGDGDPTAAAAVLDVPPPGALFTMSLEIVAGAQPSDIVSELNVSLHSPALDVAEDNGTLTLTKLAACMDHEGRVCDWDELRKIVYFRGVDPEARKEVWPLLLGLYPLGSTAAERTVICAAKKVEYYQLKADWYNTPTAESTRLQALIRNVDKDVVRTDRDFEFFGGADNVHLVQLLDILVTATYRVHPLGYTQGMTDLCAPMVYVCGDDEALAFWCFMSQLQRLGRNFDDGVTMHLHLENLRALIAVFHPDFYRFICSSDIVSMFFAYRWLLLDFKREFSFKDTLVLWETLWAQFATNHAALFVALAVVEVYGLPVMAKPRSSDYVLEYFNGLALHMDLHVVLRTMRACLFRLLTGELGTRVPVAVKKLLSCTDEDVASDASTSLRHDDIVLVRDPSVHSLSSLSASSSKTA